MAITCSKGHVNDDANRFCDQCGEPLQSPAASTGTSGATAASVPTAVGAATTNIACPVCGQENVPGTAFCDNCGAPLPPPQPVATTDAGVAPDPSSVSVAPDPSGVAADTSTIASALGDTAASAPTVTCPQCGATNDAANRFCDNCGAALDAAATPSASADATASAPADATVSAPTDATVPAEASLSADVAAPEPVVTPANVDLPAEVVASPTADVAAGDTGATDTGAADTGAADTGAAAPAPAVDVSAERARLEEQQATQRKLVEQLEQMASSFGPATPPAIRQGLDEARSALAQTEQDLAALPPAKPPVDPAEVARLEEQRATQQKLVEQLEQMASSFGPATPPAIRQGLDEARSALAQTEQELTDLTGSAPSAHPLPSALDIANQRAEDLTQTAAPAADTSTPATPAVSAPEPTAPPAQDTSTSAPAVAPTPTPEPVAQPAAPVSPQPGTDQLPPINQGASTTGPRLVGRDGKAIALPRTGGDLIIGREDPISGIHPQIDLTPFGGEAGGVSRRHASLREQGGQWLLTDLDSTNYTRVDGNRLAPNTPTPLHEGARVQFGRIDFEFHAA